MRSREYINTSIESYGTDSHNGSLDREEVQGLSQKDEKVPSGRLRKDGK